MKTIITILMSVLSYTLSFSQTYIPMPDGYGTYGGAFEPKGSYPFYENNGYIYCYTQNSASGYYIGKIAKVNVATNEVTILAGEIPNGEKPTFLKIYNGMIYFKSSSYNLLYQINPTTNTVINFSQTYLGNNQILTDYLFINNKLYFTPNGPAKVYDFISNTMTELKYYDTPTHFNYLSITGISDGIYLTGTYFNDNTVGDKIFKINDTGNTVGIISNLSSTYLGNPNFGDNSTFIKVNNNLLSQTRKVQNGVYFNKIVSINLSNNTVNADYFSYQNSSSTSRIAPYILNNTVYITDGDNVYTSDGASTPVLSNIPAFLNNQSVSYNSELPLNGNQNAILLSNNKVIGQRNYVASTNGNPATSELWISDGTLSGTRSFKNLITGFANPNITSIFANGSFYFQDVNPVNNKSYLYKTDGTAQGTYPVHQFTNPAILNFYNSGKYLYYRSSLSNSNPGLYKLDLSQLSQLSITDTEKKSQISFYPNPATANLYFSEELSDLKITDMSGKQVFSIKGKTKNISVENLPKGNYLISGKNSIREMISQKIIKN